MKKLILTIVGIALSTTYLTAQTEKPESVSNIINLEDITVLASFAKQKLNEPVVISTINAKTIAEKLSNQEFPEIMKSVPSAFATRAGGGFGDSRITLRGFGSENIGLLINGVPVNGMENGAIYWSNWAGLSETANSVQVQRGVGLSKLGLFSVGGTINIITQRSSIDPEGWVYAGVGNDGYNKFGVNYSTGLSKKGWAFSGMVSHSAGNGYVDGTNFAAWSYFADITKRINSSHTLSLTAFGAPQWHNRRSNKQSVEDYANHPRGIKMNTNYGYIDGKLTPTYGGYNEYHKPQITLNHFWTIDHKSSLSTSIYASIATGGGRKVDGVDANRLQYNFRNGKPFPESSLTPDGLIDYAPVIADNAASQTGSRAIFTMGTNSHEWYGFLSAYTNHFENNLTLTAGLETRYYVGFHFDEISDLLGGEYYINKKLAWRDPNAKLGVGDKINTDYTSYILQTGGYAQLAYDTEKINTFVSAAVTNHMNKRRDPGKYGAFSNQETYPESGVETTWRHFVPMSVKGGFNYKFSKKHRAFVNAGYVTRAPLMDNTYIDNKPISAPESEKIQTVELGYSFNTRNLYVTVNAYYTKWLDKSVSKPIGNWNGPKACIPDLDALHKGIEIEATYAPVEKLRLSGNLSIGDWRWSDDVNFVYVENGENKGEYNAYIKDLHVGNAPQSSITLSASWDILKNLTVGADFNNYSRYYADFSAIDRTNESDRADAWKMPSFSVVDMNANYRIKTGRKSRLTVYANVNNLFNKKYIADATDGTAHDMATSLVWYGFGTTWSAGVKFNF